MLMESSIQLLKSDKPGSESASCLNILNSIWTPLPESLKKPSLRPPPYTKDKWKSIRNKCNRRKQQSFEWILYLYNLEKYVISFQISNQIKLFWILNSNRFIQLSDSKRYFISISVIIFYDHTLSWFWKLIFKI